MAFKVPTYDQQVGPIEGNAPSVPNLPTPPEIAFGGRAAEQVTQSGQDLERMGTVLAQHLMERKQQAQSVEVTQADTDFRNSLQDAMFDPTPDEKTGVPKGVFNRQGFDAHGATADFDAQYKEMRDEAVAGMSTPFQQQKLAQLTAENYPRLRELVAKHEGTQIRTAQDKVIQANLDQRVNNAPLYQDDPKGLLSEIEQGQGIQYAHLRQNGIADADILGKTNSDFAKKMVVSALAPKLNENPKAAQDLFDEVSSALSPKDQAAVQKLIDDSTKTTHTRKQKEYLISTNDAEAQVAGLIANQKLTPVDFEQNWKGKVSPEFFNLAAVALKNQGTVETTPAQQSSKAVQLMQEYSRGLAESDDDKRTANLMKFRKDVLANSTKLAPDQFAKLLSWTDPNFVNQVQPKKKWFQAGLDFIANHYRDFVPRGTSPAEAMSNYVYKLTDPGTPEKDIPGLAQAAVKPDIVAAHPALMGQSDVSNNVATQGGGVHQVYGGATTLKPQQKIGGGAKFKAGDEREKGGVTYVRGEDGLWRPKPQ